VFSLKTRMKYRQQTLDELSRLSVGPNDRTALVGLDGFVDKLITPVSKRFGPGDNFEPITTIESFGQRILAAAGKSTNIEMYPKMEKLGGNGPIMANALRHLGVGTRYVGALGHPTILPVFEDFAAATQAISIAEPGITHALEFDDGKLMLGNTISMEDITYQAIIDATGEGAFFELFSRSDLIAMVNWTMIPGMTRILNAFLDKVLPNLGPRDHRRFFFDLADPEKRSDADIANLLKVIARYKSHGYVTLGLNLKEAQQIDRILGFSPLGEDPDSLKELASRLQRTTGLSCIAVHPTASAACATKDDAWWTPGPFVAKPKITTGAGDHFNAGFCTGQLLGLSPAACLTVAVATSGSYVRSARSPSLEELNHFISSWTDEAPL
jgi:hypothetical protein